MALNCSRGMILPSYSPRADNLCSRLQFSNLYMEGAFEDRNFDHFYDPYGIQSVNLELDRSHDLGVDMEQLGEHHEVVAEDDIASRLPNDPFGMNVRSTVTAHSGWLDDADNFRFGECTTDGKSSVGVNWNWNRNGSFKPDVGATNFGKESMSYDSYGAGCSSGFEVEVNRRNWFSDDEAEMRDSQVYLDMEEGTPHNALPYVLGYLDVQGLLTVEAVCKSLLEAVRGDPFLWRNIHIDQPLSDKITDDALLQLTNKAQGKLQCLSLIKCRNITNNGLRLVLESNLEIKKLSVPECLKLTVDGILINLRALKYAGTDGIVCLRIGGKYNITKKQYEELNSLLHADRPLLMGARKPHFYHLGISSDDNRALDIEICPICHNLRLVFDCPAESCRRELNSAQSCRACIICIARCIHCGRCLKDCNYDENFCLDKYCLDCKHFEERREASVPSPSSSGRTGFHQEMAPSHFCG